MNLSSRARIRAPHVATTGDTGAPHLRPCQAPPEFHPQDPSHRPSPNPAPHQHNASREPPSGSHSPPCGRRPPSSSSTRNAPSTPRTDSSSHTTHRRERIRQASRERRIPRSRRCSQGATGRIRRSSQRWPTPNPNSLVAPRGCTRATMAFEEGGGQQQRHEAPHQATNRLAGG